MGVGFVGNPSANPVQGVGNPLFDKVTGSSYSSFGGGAFYTLVSPQDLLSGGFFTPGGQLSAGELRSLMIGDNSDPGFMGFDPADFPNLAAHGIAGTKPVAADPATTSFPSWLLIGGALLLLFLFLD